MIKKQDTRFSFACLGVKECTFIKSLLSVYKGRAKSNWIHQDNNSGSDVIFLGSLLENGSSYDSLDIKPWQFVIFYGPSDVKLTFPLLYRVGLDEFAGNLLEAIEACEDFLVTHDSQEKDETNLRRQHLHAVLGFSHEESQEDISSNEKFKLLRWPSASFMQKNKEYAILAALLIHREMGFDEFSERSGVSVDLCSEFLKSVRDQGFLAVSVDVKTNTKINQVEKLGLFDRIRHRLGLKRRAKKI